MSQRNSLFSRTSPFSLVRKGCDKKSNSRVRRTSGLEMLEARTLMAGDIGAAYQNNLMAADVNSDGRVTNLDAFQIINELRRYGTRDLNVIAPRGLGGEGEDAANPLLVDVNGDNIISPLDAFLVISAIRAEGQEDVAEVKLTLLTTGNVPLGKTALNVGDSFQVYVTIEDIRTSVPDADQGIVAAYLDINWAPALLEATGTPNFAPISTENAYSQTSGDQRPGTLNNSTGTIDEIGNVDFSNNSLQSTAKTLVRQTFQVQAAPTLLATAAVNDTINSVLEDQTNVILNVLNNDDKVGTTVIDAAQATGLGHELLTLVPTAAVSVNDTIYTDATVRVNTAVTITSFTTPSAGGSLSITAGGQSLTYTPLGNYHGPETFTYTITGAGGGTSTATVTVNVQSQNDNPTAINDPVSVQLNSTNNILTVLSNDVFTPDTGETLTITGITQPVGGGSVSISGGNSTLTYTPPTGFTGQQTFTYTISDGNGGSSTATVTATVSAGNASPIANPDGFSINEGSTLGTTLLTTLFTGNDSPGTGETGQTITLTQINGQAVANTTYLGSLGGTLTVTNAGTGTASATYTPPNADFFGVDTFSYQITDNGTTGGNPDFKTATGTLSITVNAVNDAPSFTKGADQIATDDDGLQTIAGWATNLSKGPANESAQTLTFNITGNTNPSIFNVAPAISSNGTLTFTPKPGASGSATISVQLQDSGDTANGGTNVSAIQTFIITVLPPTLPRAKPDSGSVNEDDTAGVTINVLQNDDKSVGSTLSITGTTNPTNGTVVVNPDKTITYTPNANFSGSDSFTYTINDDDALTNDGPSTATVNITVNALNDAPTFTGGPNQIVNEDPGAQSIPNWATSISAGAANESTQTLTFLVTNNSNSSLFASGPAISANGTLTYTLNPNVNGSASITVVLQDNGPTGAGQSNTSTPFTFSITVNAVNDPPSFVKGADQTVNEDAGAQTVANWATSINKGAANESGQNLTFNITGNTNPSLFSTAPAISSTGTLTYTPAANAFGTTTITVTLSDDGGGSDTSGSQTFTITVNSKNDAPSFVKGADQVVTEDSGPHTVNGWATSLSTGPANESGQTLSFEVTGNTNPGLFASGPAISANGTLTYTLNQNANGGAQITVVVHDNGGTANSGSDTSAPQTFNIFVTDVNDAPVATNDTFTAFTNGGAQTFNPITNTAPNGADTTGAANESGQTLTLTSVTPLSPANNTPGTIVVNPNGTFTYTPSAAFEGTITFTYVITDNGTTAGAADPKTGSGTITINVLKFEPSSISGIVFADGNGDGVYTAGITAGERTLGDVEVTIAGTTTFPNTTLPGPQITGADGLFKFENVAPGDYIITVTPPEHSTGSTTPLTYTVHIGELGGEVKLNAALAVKGLEAEFVSTFIDNNASTPRTGVVSLIKLNPGAASYQYWFSLLEGWTGFKKVTISVPYDIAASGAKATISATLSNGTVLDPVEVKLVGDPGKRLLVTRRQGDDITIRLLGSSSLFFPNANGGSGEGIDWESETNSSSLLLAPTPVSPSTSASTLSTSTAASSSTSTALTSALAPTTSTIVVGASSSQAEGESLSTLPAAKSTTAATTVSSASTSAADTHSTALTSVASSHDIDLTWIDAEGNSTGGLKRLKPKAFASQADSVFASGGWLRR